MKSFYSLYKDKRAVFGLSSVQAFFTIILGIALLAYVIIVVMGTLDNANIIPSGSLSGAVGNESSFLNSSGDTLNQVNVPGFTGAAIVTVINGSSGTIIPSTNYTLTNNVLRNSSASPIVWQNANVSYTYSYNSDTANSADSILTNTSLGISNFFGAINPVYAILAILVIILVLVVLVRVVTGNNAGEFNRDASPQL